MQTTTTPSVVTGSGLLFPFTAPRSELIRLDDISNALSKINRYSGNLATNISVAAHSIAVRELARSARHKAGLRKDPVLELAALLHDAAEAYIGDITKPVRNALLAETNLIDQWEVRIQDALAERLGFDPALFMSAEIKAADRECAYQEVGVMVRGFEQAIKEMSEDQSEDKDGFTDRSELLALKPGDFGHDHAAWPDGPGSFSPIVVAAAGFAPKASEIYFILALESICRDLENTHPKVAERLTAMLLDAGTRSPIFVKQNRHRVVAMMQTEAPVPFTAREALMHAADGVGAILTGQHNPKGKQGARMVAARMMEMFANIGLEAGCEACGMMENGIVDATLAQEDPALALMLSTAELLAVRGGRMVSPEQRSDTKH